MPAFYRNFHFKAPRFHPGNSSGHVLHVRLRPQQVSLGITTSANRLELVSQLDTQAVLAYGPMLQLAMQEEPLLCQSYHEIRITIPAVAFTPVPILSATTSGLDEIHLASGGGPVNQPGIQTISQTSVELGIQFAMDFVQEDIDAITSQLPAAQIRCEEMTTALLGKQISSQFPHLILAEIYRNQACFAVFQQQNLAFLNRFTWSSPQDILYFLQLSHHAAGLPESPDILLMGDLDAQSEPFRTIARHIRNARILEREAASLFDDPEHKVPYARFADLAI